MVDGNRALGPGRVVLVGAGPGAADLITVRGHRLLQQADAVVHDDLAAAELYESLQCHKIDVGKRCGRHKMRQPEINKLLIELAWQHRLVVRLKGGDPFVLGRGSEEVMHLAHNGVPCEVVPGVSSVMAAPMVAGIPVTHRGVASSFCVVSCHPREDITTFGIPAYDPQRTLVVLMGVKTMPLWIAELHKLGYPGDLPCAFVTWATRPQAQSRFCALEGVADLAESLQAPTVAVIGMVVEVAARTRNIASVTASADND